MHAKTHTGARPIAVTLGDPSGIGPEIAMRALRDRQELAQGARPYVVIGDRFIAERSAEHIGWKVNLPDHRVDAGRASLSILDTHALDPARFEPSRVSEASGRAALAALEAAVELITTGQVAALVTAPVNKEAVCLADRDFVDQAGFFASRFAVDPEAPVTMVTAGRYHCFLVTKHIPLAEVPGSLRRERIAHVVLLAQQTLQALGVDPPRLVVASLNPHVGEGGMLGTEELEIIRPALVAAQPQLKAPILLTTGKAAFAAVGRGERDGVVAMYHDQSAPVELLGGAASTVTLGLPVVRTSVGHGTAFDRAWRGGASPAAMINAMTLTEKLVSG